MAVFSDKIVLIDFGSQYTLLIARALRKLGVFFEISATFPKTKDDNLRGIILSGGPGSVINVKTKRGIKRIVEIGVPILGICYGFQLLAEIFGGKVEKGKISEFGKVSIKVLDNSLVFEGTPHTQTVWMSHYDTVSEVPDTFEITSKTENNLISSFENKQQRIFAVQFHPEVKHTEYGLKILGNFLEVCKVRNKYEIDVPVISKLKENIANKVGSTNVIAGLSGGVDSTVLARLISEAIGHKFYGVFVDNGLLREDEGEEVFSYLKKLLPAANLKYVDAGDCFLNALKGVKDPELKREIIGHTFIDVFKDEAAKIDSCEFLAQGTLYPDVIESGFGPTGRSVKIKSHHNVGGLPAELGFKLLEPFRSFFKDEVREIGLLLGIPNEILNRHPFPGPGLAVRILGNITNSKLEILRKSDKIFIDELFKAELYYKIWQAFCVFLPVKTVGIKGDKRSFENVISLRAVNSVDGMTAESSDLPISFLKNVARRIANEVVGVNRVVYDLSSKPPGTIEWE